MIDYYTIKFSPAVTQKDLENALHQSGEMVNQVPELRKMKARIDVVCDFDDSKRLSELLRSLERPSM